MIELLGWAGTLATFAAYVFISRGLLHSASRRYIWMNIVGGLLGGTASSLYGAWPSVASNALWAVIGLHALLSRRLAPRTAVVVAMDQQALTHTEGDPVGAADHDDVTWRIPAVVV